MTATPGGPFFSVMLCCSFMDGYFFSLFYKFLVIFSSHYSFYCCSFETVNLYIILALIILGKCGDIHPNPGPQFFRGLYCNIRGLKANLNDLAVASPKYDLLFCSETLVSNYRHVSELLIPNFNKPILLRRNAIRRAQGMALYVRSSFSASRVSKYECGCHEVLLTKIVSRFNNYYIFACYRNPDLDDSIYDCLLSSMATIQSVDSKASFVFIGDFNGHHREWLGSISGTNQHGHALLDFSNLSGCDQLVRGPTHISGNCLDLLLTDAPAVVDTNVIPPFGTSDHSGISFKIQTSFSLPNDHITVKVYLKSRANWQGVFSDFNEINWPLIYRSDCPITELNKVLLSISDRRIPCKTIRSRRKDKAWFNDECRRAQREKQTAFCQWSRSRSPASWNNYIHHRLLAQRIYVEAQTNYHSHLKEILTGASQPHVWWSALKQSLFGVDTSLPPLSCADGSVCSSAKEKADLLASVFIDKQSDVNLQLPSTCHPQVGLSSFAFKSKELLQYLRDLDSFGGCDPLGFLPIFYKTIAAPLAPKLAKIFRILLSRGSFPQCWRIANITPIPKGSAPSIHPNDYRPISITPVLSKIFERLLARRLTQFLDINKILPMYQFAYKKGVGTSDALLCICHNLQTSLDAGQESRIVSLDFSSAFDLVNHKALLFKVRSLGIGGRVLGVIMEFLSNRRQRVSVDGSFSSFNCVKSGVPQGSVLGPLLFIIYTSDMWSQIQTNMVAYADDTTLFAPIASPRDRSHVAELISQDLVTIKSWCDLWGMRLNPSKSRSLVISRSRTLFPSHPDLVVDGDIIGNCSSLKLLGVTLDAKLSFEEHLRSVAASISQKVGLLRKCSRVYSADDVVRNTFYSFLLPHFEYCHSVWLSASECHLRLLDRAFGQIRFLLPDLRLDLRHRRVVGALAHLFKIANNTDHPLHSLLPDPLICSRITRYSGSLNDRSFVARRFMTSQYSRTFFLATIERWNSLPNEVVHSSNCEIFKKRVNSFLLHQ